MHAPNSDVEIAGHVTAVGNTRGHRIISIFLIRRWLARSGLSDRLDLQRKPVANYEKSSRNHKFSVWLPGRASAYTHGALETSKRKAQKPLDFRDE
jgi:hypothetical protein